MAKTPKRTPRGTPRTPTTRDEQDQLRAELKRKLRVQKEISLFTRRLERVIEENSQKLAEFCVYVMAMKTGENKTDTLERIEADAPRP
jgi:hypothetical protein